MPHGSHKSHADNQATICGVCLEKSKNLRNISELTYIRKLVFRDYNKTKDDCETDVFQRKLEDSICACSEVRLETILQELQSQYVLHICIITKLTPASATFEVDNQMAIHN